MCICCCHKAIHHFHRIPYTLTKRTNSQNRHLKGECGKLTEHIHLIKSQCTICNWCFIRIYSCFEKCILIHSFSLFLSGCFWYGVRAAQRSSLRPSWWCTQALRFSTCGVSAAVCAAAGCRRETAVCSQGTGFSVPETITTNCPDRPPPTQVLF